MRQILVSIVVFAFGLPLAGVLRAEEEAAKARPAASRQAQEAMTPGQVADAVLKAVKAKDRRALKAVAERDVPDPWLVADELCYRGEHGAAKAFARAASGKAVAKLPAYVASRRGKEPNENARGALLAMNEAIGRGAWQKALDLADGVGPKLGSVVLVQVAYSRGLPLRKMRRLGESAKVLVEAGEAALRMGWLSRAASAFQEGGLDAFDNADMAGAISAWRSRLAASREIGDYRATYDTLRNIGVVQANLGNSSEALRSFNELLAIAREKGDKPGTAKMFHNIGTVLKRLGNFPEALQSHGEALAIRREIGDKQGLGDSLNDIGVVQNHLEKHHEALRSLDEALAIRREIGNRQRIADTLHNIGLVQAGLGNYPEALRYYREALAIRRTTGNKQGLAKALNNIGIVQQGLGNYPEALRAYDEVLAIRRAMGDRRGIAGVLNNIGIVQRILGNYAEALRSYEASLAICREVGDKQSAIGTLNNLGNVQHHVGDYDEALRSYEESLAIRREIGNQHGVAATLINIGLVQQYLGNYAEALRRYDESIALDREIGNTQGIAAALTNVGHVQGSLGNHAASLEAYTEAKGILADAPNPDTEAHVLWGLARYYLRQGLPVKAVNIARQGVQLVGGLAEGLAEGEGAGARDSYTKLFDVGTRAASHSGQLADLLWFLEQGRAGSLREGLGSRASLERAVLPEALLAALEQARGGERRALAAYREAGSRGRRKEIRSTRRAWEEARAEVEQMTARIQREAKAAAAVVFAATDDLEVTQSRLRPDEALLLFGLTSEDAVALVVRKDKTRMVALPESKEIESAVDALLDDDDRYVVPDQVDALSRLLVEPLEIDEDVKRVLVSPVARLGYVPFTLLFPDREVVYVPSGTVYGLLREERQEGGEGILALGDPDYEATTDAAVAAQRVSAPHELTPLPGTRGEVEALGTTTLLGADASESGLRGVLVTQERWRAVHFACHGLVDPERPMLSALALTADKANDGFLTALEIFRMKIPADLVVMSACETGKGRIYRTEGIVGLTRACMFAGAPRVICSLWKVDDEATRALMIKFYELWNPKDGSRGLGAAAALKKSQEYVRDHPNHPEWKHPYYWAAWVLWGLPD